jgi:hypothetical protein
MRARINDSGVGAGAIVASHRCQRCGSTHLRHSRRKTIIEMVILPVLLIRPYRCTQCHMRQYGIGFHRFRRQLSSTALALVMLIALVTGLAGSLYVLLVLIAR